MTKFWEIPKDSGLIEYVNPDSIVFIKMEENDVKVIFSSGMGIAAEKTTRAGCTILGLAHQECVPIEKETQAFIDEMLASEKDKPDIKVVGSIPEKLKQ